MIALGLLALLFQLHVVVSKAAGNLTGDLRIVGGTDADAFPTLAFSAGSKLCAATLIYPEYVLSTAMIQMNIHLTYSYNVYTTIFDQMSLRRQSTISVACCCQRHTVQVFLLKTGYILEEIQLTEQDRCALALKKS